MWMCGCSGDGGCGGSTVSFLLYTSCHVTATSASGRITTMQARDRNGGGKDDTMREVQADDDRAGAEFHREIGPRCATGGGDGKWAEVRMR